MEIPWSAQRVLDGALVAAETGGGGGARVLRALLGLPEQKEERGPWRTLILAGAPLQYLFKQEVYLLNSWGQSLKSERHGSKGNFCLSPAHGFPDSPPQVPIAAMEVMNPDRELPAQGLAQPDSFLLLQPNILRFLTRPMCATQLNKSCHILGMEWQRKTLFSRKLGLPHTDPRTAG